MNVEERLKELIFKASDKAEMNAVIDMLERGIR